jgi:Amino acid permease
MVQTARDYNEPQRVLASPLCARFRHDGVKGALVTDTSWGITKPSASESSLEQFGYRQELKRSLGLASLVVYGLVFINPTSPFSIFGIVFNLSHGMVPLVYCVGLVAMVFTALSYVMMSRAFPIAGSVYSYAGRGIGDGAGFLAGWALLLDYVLMPTLVYVLCAIAIQALLPGFPRVVSIVVVLSFNTAINLLGIEASARLNGLLLALMLAFLGLFFVLAGIALTDGVAGAHLSAAPLFNPEFTPALIFSALPRLRRHLDARRGGAWRCERGRSRHDAFVVYCGGFVRCADLADVTLRAGSQRLPAG